jgi:peptidoglycan hydrolase CwlO-like protein
MSDDKVSLEFLGEQMLRMQTDVRGVRSEQTRQDGELQNLGGKIDVVDAKVDAVDAKVDRVEKKLDNFAASVDARFDQVNQTMATNLEVMLKAFDAGKG